MFSPVNGFKMLAYDPVLTKRRSGSSRSGFTLVEIMITVVILAALAGLAVPNYTKTIEVARSSEGKADLQQIYAGQAYYKLNVGTYWNPGLAPAVADVNATLRTSLGTDYYTIQQINGTAGTAFTAVAKRANTSTKVFTITQASGTPIEAGDY